MAPTRLARSLTSLVLVAAPLAAGGAASASVPAGGTPVLRPNLVTLPFGDVAIRRAPGVRELRFSNTVGNRGPGVLELFPVADDCDGDGDPQDDRSAYQRLYGDTDGDGVFTRGVDQPVGDRFVGCMIFHPEHDHWHLEDFARYALTRPATGRVVALADKVSFCVRDSFTAWSLPGTPTQPVFGECTQDGTTGMSVGWADLYGADLFGQSLDLRGVPDGRYCLRSLADPSRRIAARRDDDNHRSLGVRIRGSTVRTLPGPC